MMDRARLDALVSRVATRNPIGGYDEKGRGAMMGRILLLAMVAVMMVTMLGVTAGPVSATIHSISCGDKSEDNEEAADNPVEEENPPGISNDDEDAVVDNGENATERQPVRSVNNDAPDESQANEHARNGEKTEHCERE